jgi:hypothetical protein
MKLLRCFFLVFAVLLFVFMMYRSVSYVSGRVVSLIWQPRIVCVEPLYDFGKITISHQPRSNNESESNTESKADTKSEPNAESKSNAEPKPNADPQPNSASETLAQQKLPHAKPTHEFIIKNEGNADLIRLVPKLKKYNRR